MSPSDPRWNRLIALARQAPERDVALPPGFVTRVVARSASAPALDALLERFAVRGFWAALACCAAVTVFNFVERTPESPEEVGLDDPIASVLDFS